MLSDNYLNVKSKNYFNPILNTAPPHKESVSSRKVSAVKKCTDTVATGLWLTAIGFTIYKTGMFRPKNPENILYKAKKVSRKYSKLYNMSKIQEEENLDKYLQDSGKIKRFITKLTYKLGSKFQNSKTRMGEELYNNFINSLGKLIIMPLAICAMPVGNKKSSKEEKASLIIREPLSVLATFTLQGAFDKIFDIYMPKILGQNLFETDEVQRDYKANGKISTENFDKIKYNPNETKRIFVELASIDKEAGGLKGILSPDLAEKLVTLDAFEPQTYESYVRNFDKVVTSENLTQENIELIKNKFKVVSDSIGNYELAKMKPKIAMNIIAVVILSRIFLNVIHGKTVKLLKLDEKSSKKQEAKNE